MTSLSSPARHGKPISLEKFREAWQRQIVLHRDAPASLLKVALAIGWHFNRKKAGLAWPGIRTISRLGSLAPSTVVKAVKWLEANGYMRVNRQRVGNRRRPNEYLPLLREAEQGANRVFALGRTGCSPQRRTEPSTEPSTEPLTLCKNIAATEVAVLREESEQEERGIRESKGSIESPTSEAYRLAREYEGELGASRVAMALNHGADPIYVLEDVRVTVEERGDLGESLAYHWIGKTGGSYAWNR
jgi:hypothetical protein